VEYVYSDVPVPPRRPPPLRQSVEAYFSDENLKRDRHLREIIVESPGGWVDIDTVLELKRVRALKAKRVEVLRALRDSPLFEIWHDPVDGAAAVRRAKGRPLPKFEGAAPPPVSLPQKRTAPVFEAEDAAPPDEVAAPPPPDPDVEDLEAEDGVIKRIRHISAEVKPGARFVGRVKSFHNGLGMGFISCRPTFEVYGRDIAVDRAALGNFDVGDYVAFGLCVDSEFGTAKGVELEVADEADADQCVQAAPAPAPMPVRKFPLQVARTLARPVPTVPAPAKPVARKAKAAAAATAAGLADMRFVGKLLAAAEAGTGGKINCPETFTALGRHVPVAQEEMAGFEPGDKVSFALREGKAVELEAE